MLALACVAALPATSETLAVRATAPGVSVLTSAEAKVTLQAPPVAMMAVSEMSPNVTVTVRPSAPTLVPETVRSESSSALLT